MKRILLAFALIPSAAFALGPYACHPAQSMAGPGQMVEWKVSHQAMCAVWTCAGKPQLAVALTSALAPSMVTDWQTLNSAPNLSVLNTMRTKYAKDDVCSAAMLPAWSGCRAKLTPEQIKQLCPALK